MLERLADIGYARLAMVAVGFALVWSAKHVVEWIPPLRDRKPLSVFFVKLAGLLIVIVGFVLVMSKEI